MFRTTVLAGLAWSLCSAALAATPDRFAIPSQPLQDAVIAFGGQAGISIGSGAAQSCGWSRALHGRFEIETGLSRLLSGTGCTWRRIDDRAYVIVRSQASAPIWSWQRYSAPGSSQPVEEAPTAVADVIVTATREDRALADTPYALTALGGQDFDTATRRDTADLATRISGLTLTNLGPGRNKLFVRGLADGPLTGQTQAMVGLYLDDTRLTYDVPDPDLRLVDVERVELLRGPQGTLYGAGSIGGILQIVTRPPDLRRYSTEVFAAAVTTEGAGAGQSADLVLNLPVLRDRIALRAVGYSEKIAGTIDDVALGVGNTGDTVREGGRLNLLWRIDPAWDLRLGYVAQTLHSDDSQYAFSALRGDRRALAVREPSSNDFDGVSATLSGELGWGRVKIDTAVQTHGLDRRYDATLGAAGFGGGGPTAYDESDSIKALVTEATLSSTPGGRLTWLIGLFATEYTHDRMGDMTTLPSGASLYAAARRDHTDETAVYGQASWSLTDRLRVTAGGRIFHIAVETRASSMQGAVPSDALNSSRSDSGFAPKIVIEYDLRDTILLYLQSSEGYRAGGFNAGVVPGQAYGVSGGAQPYRTFRSDELVSYEAGARLRLWNDSLAVRLAVFAIDWRSVQSDRIGSNGLPFTGNIGNAATAGFEGEMAWTSGLWRLDANLMIDDPDLNDPDPGLPLPTTGDLSGVSNLIARAAVRRDMTLLSRPSWISASLGYVGAATLTFSATQIAEMGDYWTSDLGAGVEFPAWSLSARIDNLLDQGGDTFAYGNPFLVGRVGVTTPQRPRSLSIQISRRF